MQRRLAESGILHGRGGKEGRMGEGRVVADFALVLQQERGEAVVELGGINILDCTSCMQCSHNMINPSIIRLQGFPLCIPHHS